MKTDRERIEMEGKMWSQEIENSKKENTVNTYRHQRFSKIQ